MKIQQFLSHYGIKENPFGQEDAQSDQVFKQHCIEGTYHPAWDKVYGSPEEPATAVVFGEKGSGKTALRLQVVDHLRQHNETHPDKRVFVIEYDDFNPFLDCFRERLSGRRRKPERALQYWRLWDHMDAILELGVTKLDDDLLGEPPGVDKAFAVRPEDVDKLTHTQRRDLLLLAAFYDHSLATSAKSRWQALRKRLRFNTLLSMGDLAFGIGTTVLLIVLWLSYTFETYNDRFLVLRTWWFWTILGIAWLPWVWRQTRLFWTAWSASRQVRVIDHQPNALRQILSRFLRSELAGQPMPTRDRSDDRYELLNKFRSALRSLGFQGIMVLVDRVDEPHLVNGSAERMRDLLWPMFDNKFLKQPGMGFKLLLPAEVSHYVNREDREFYERSRLDKQNLIPSLEWTGESLYDVANSRIHACATTGNGQPGLQSLFDDTITHPELVATLGRLRVPRHLFKFMYRLLVNHCNKFTDENPKWKIDRETLHATLALYQRDLDAFDRGFGTG
jgi:hypothetical protein